MSVFDTTPAELRPRHAVVRMAIVVSGKRKSGKDYCSDLLWERCGEVAEIGRLSAPLKKAFADEKGLDYDQLLTASAYKEQYRHEMILWGEERRAADPGFFAREVLARATKPVLIVSDARRPSDVAFFKAHVATVLTVRVEASETARTKRGWRFAPGVDDAESECGLDHHSPWDAVIINEGTVTTGVAGAGMVGAQIESLARAACVAAEAAA